MKKYILFSTLTISILMIMMTCQPLTFGDFGTTQVSIDTGINLSGDRNRAVKNDVSSFQITVSADGMETIKQSFAEQIIELEIEAGPARTFTLEALDAKQNVIFSGSNTLDLTAGETTTIVIKMDFEGFYVIFETNGANSIPVQFVSAGSVVSEPAEPVMSNYVFGGWYTDTELNSAWVFADNTVSNDITLYAKWTASEYSITYNLNNGTNNASNPASYTTESPAIPLAAPSRTGYIFDGWYTDEEMSSSPVTEIKSGSTGNVTIYAKWTTDGYSISYKLDSGSNNVDNPLSYTVATPTITLSDPTRTGYSFDGWYTDDSFSSQIKEITSGSTGNITVYAKWTIAEYSITYNLNGGANSGSNPAIYAITSSTIAFADPVRSGYTFDGWYTDSEFTTQKSEIKSGSIGDITLYAKWTVVTYSIIYNLNSGTNNGSNPATYTITSSTITLAAPNRSGYIFSGWFMEAAFTTQKTEIATGSTGNIMLYAKWTAISGDIYILGSYSSLVTSLLESYSISYTIGSEYVAGYSAYLVTHSTSDTVFQTLVDNNCNILIDAYFADSSSKFTELYGTWDYNMGRQTSTIENTTHPITTGYTGTISFSSNGGRIVRSTSGSFTPLMSCTDGDTQTSLGYIDGAAKIVFGGVFFIYDEDFPGYASAEAKELFIRSIQWLSQ